MLFAISAGITIFGFSSPDIKGPLMPQASYTLMLLLIPSLLRQSFNKALSSIGLKLLLFSLNLKAPDIIIENIAKTPINHASASTRANFS
ncbi:hypothetical protein SDC9_206563 [bioreactor metagenome]|uniref:Uncharacterized protein n=1 Tax=bioreactor metagenome TaxID=1076179 RepID=A0A645J634_9ZZZZ